MEMTLQGVRVHYEIGGHGERKVVLLHGWGCSEKLMAGISDALTPDMTVLRVDFPAHGESGFPPQPWGVPDFAANLLELLTKLDFLPCSVIAHSFGGRVAIELAADHSERFEKLILTGAAGIRPKLSSEKSKKSQRYQRLKKLVGVAKKTHLFGSLPDKWQENLVQKYGSRDYAALSRLLNLPLKAVYESETVVKALNPIPSRGFYSGDAYHNYIVPEATVICRDGQLTVEMNTRSLPRISPSQEYTAMLGRTEDTEVQDYLRKCLTAAKSTIAQIDSRQSTLQSLLLVIIRRQQGYFMGTDQMQPMTMQQVADEMRLNTSTVSRAVKDKYIQFQTRLIPLRSLFSSSLQGDDGSLVSADAVKQQLRLFIRAEDPGAPLSDEALTAALASVGVHISRRTVAKYRAELNIPTAAARKRDSRNRT